MMKAIGAGAVVAGLLLSACGSGGATTSGTAAAASGSASAATASASGHFRYRGTGSATAGGFRGGAGGGFLNLSAAATYLGISSSQLQQDMRSGKSLAQVAQAQGKTAQGLEQALVAAAKTQMDQAVSAGHMTSAQEQQQLASLQQRIAQLVNRVATASATSSGS